MESFGGVLCHSDTFRKVREPVKPICEGLGVYPSVAVSTRAGVSLVEQVEDDGGFILAILDRPDGLRDVVPASLREVDHIEKRRHCHGVAYVDCYCRFVLSLTCGRPTNVRRVFVLCHRSIPKLLGPPRLDAAPEHLEQDEGSY